MPKQRNSFNYSIKYAYSVRDSVESYSHRLRMLYTVLTKDKFENSKDFYKKYTAFKDSNLLKGKSDSTYNYYNITRNFIRNSIIQPKENFDIANTICFIFNSEQAMKNFVKDLRFTRKQIPYGFCIKFNSNGKRHPVFGIQIALDKGIHKNVLAKIAKKYTEEFLSRTNRYGNVIIAHNIVFPSKIYDRWVDPFTGKVITDLSKILPSNDFKDYEENISKISVKDLIFKITPFIEQFNLHYRAKKSRSSDFISNKDRIDKDYYRIHTYIVNHYMMQKNPYKRAQARKDWKFAAETLLSEVIGKYIYKNDLFNARYSDNALIAEFDNNSSLAFDYHYAEERFQEHKIAIEKIKNELIELEEKVKLHGNCYDSQLKSTKIALDNEEMRLKWSQDDINRYKTRYEEELNAYLVKRKAEAESIKEQELGLQFSKAEIRSFIKSLNLKTKIDCNKFRKKVLDTLLELNILKTDFRYQIKLTCRTYNLNFDWLFKFYKKIKGKICFYFYINFNFYKNSIIMLENVLFNKRTKKLMFNNRVLLAGRRSSAPPLFSTTSS